MIQPASSGVPAGPGAACSPLPSYAYVPALDGMRAASVLLVIASHLGLGAVVPGGFGVTVFFFLSGFLITRQLLAEQAAQGRVALPGFYLRRVLRLYPALLAMVALGGGAFALLGGPVTRGQVAAALLYAINYDFLLGGLDATGVSAFHPYSILWSLAVEEHFYILFPLMVILFGRRAPRFALLVCALLAVALLWRTRVALACLADPAACMGTPEDRVVRGTDTRIDSILFGVLLAVLPLTGLAGRALRLLRSPAALAAGAALILLSLALRSPLFRDTARFSIQGVGLLLAAGFALFSPGSAGVALRRALSRRPMVLVGRWSYSLYLWHWIVLVCASLALPDAVGVKLTSGSGFGRAWFLIAAPLLLLMSFLLATASYYGIERPMLRLRRRFGSHAVADQAALREGVGGPSAAAWTAARVTGAARAPQG